MTAPRKCPRCGSGNVFRSHRRMLEYFLPRVRPFRCYACKFRFREFIPFFSDARRQ